MKTKSIQQQIIRRILMSVFLVFIVAGMFSDFLLVQWLNDEYDKRLLTKAQVLATLTKDEITKVEFDFADEFMPEFEADESPEYFELWQHDIGLLERSNSVNKHARNISISDLLFTHITLDNLTYGYADLQLPDGRDGRMIQVVFYPQIPDKNQRTNKNLKKQKKITLTVAREREGLDRLTRNIHMIFIGSLLLILYVMGIIISYSVKSGLSPLDEMQEKIAGLDVKSLDQRIELKNPPEEVEQLVLHFNHLLEKLDSSFKREQQFSSDVAHDLRTPIAEIRNLTELSIKWPDDKTIQQNFHKDILASTKQMQQLLNNLLNLARCENNQILLTNTKLELCEQIDAAWQRHLKDAENKNITINFDQVENYPFISSETEFSNILNNIISNAVEYSPENSTIFVKIIEDSQGIGFTVTNPATDLVLNDIEYMANRLWRKKISRTSSEHSGLGLSLVEAYAHLLGLKIRMALNENKEFSIQITGIDTFS